MSANENAAALELSTVLKKHFAKHDSGYLESIGEALAGHLAAQQRRGITSSASMRLQLRDVPWLAQQLRKLREERGLTREDVCKVTEWSVSKLLRKELGSIKFTYADVVNLIQIYEVTDQRMIDRLKKAASSKR